MEGGKHCNCVPHPAACLSNTDCEFVVARALIVAVARLLEVAERGCPPLPASQLVPETACNPGICLSKSVDRSVQGSPLNVLSRQSESASSCGHTNMHNIYLISMHAWAGSISWKIL